MRVFSRLRGVRARNRPWVPSSPAWGPLLGHLPTSPAPGWPAARVPVGPGTPPSPRGAAAHGEGCDRLSWAVPHTASTLRHQQDSKDVPRSLPGARHCGAPAHGASRRKSGATVLQLAFGRKERKETTDCAQKRPPGFACPGLPLPGLGIPTWAAPPYPKRPCSSPRPPWVTRCLAPSLAQTESDGLTTHTSTQVRGPAVGELSAGSTVSRDTFLECTGRGPRGPARNSSKSPETDCNIRRKRRPDSARRNTWRDTHPARNSATAIQRKVTAT